MLELLDTFHPRIINIFHRDREFWSVRGPEIRSQQTNLLSFLYVYAGEGELQINDEAFALAEGCAFQIPHGRRLRLQTSIERKLCYYTVQYDYAVVEWEGGQATCSPPADRMLPLSMVVNVPDQEGMRHQFERLYRLWESRRIGYIGKSKLLFMGIIQSLLDQQYAHKAEDPKELAVLACVQYIDAHYGGVIHRDELAQRASMSSSYFSILFKKYIGCSPLQYVARVRLNHAMQMLRESSMPISQVAREVGYQDPLYFTRVFTREIGISPREYRNT